MTRAAVPHIRKLSLWATVELDSKTIRIIYPDELLRLEPLEKAISGAKDLRENRESNVLSRPEESWACGPPKVMKNAFGPATALQGSVALSFVIPSAAEGSAVSSTSHQCLQLEDELSSRLPQRAVGPKRTQISYLAYSQRPRMRLSVEKDV